ncbi:MAG TPA: MBL fold metallo-hydrolase [Syntrophorhabdaceae bacterium]|jgi:glyoxylase-like metal-dependent hydrolase (beta-lactamase superfamily II)
MIVQETGEVKEGFYITGLASYPVQLLDGMTPVLFDAGTTCAGELYVEAIREVLGKREPALLLISHVHWDHCGAASYLKKAFPSMKIAMSAKAAEVLKRPGAVKLITNLNRSARSIVPTLPGGNSPKLIDDDFEPFEIDREVKDGDIIDLGEGLTVHAMATPGHTRDHMSYYIPGEQILLAAEASGCLAGSGEIIPEFLSDYDAYFASLQALARLPVRVLCQGHRMVFVGRKEVRSFFERSAESAIRFRARICDLLKAEEGAIERVVRRIKEEQYDSISGIKQPEIPYLLNLTAQVTHLARKSDCS